MHVDLLWSWTNIMHVDLLWSWTNTMYVDLLWSWTNTMYVDLIWPWTHITYVYECGQNTAGRLVSDVTARDVGVVIARHSHWSVVSVRTV